MDILEELKFSGYDPKPVMEAKLNKMLEVIKQLQIEVEKLKLPEATKKATKTTKAE